MITSIILMVFSIALVMIGLRMMGMVTAHPSSKQQENGPSVTVSGKSAVVTVRNAAGGDVKVFFGNQHSPEKDHVIPYSGTEDKTAEEEVTILDELRNPDTPAERKAQIETELLALGYRIIPKEAQAPKKGFEPKGQIVPDNRPERKPSSDKPSEKDDPDDNDIAEGTDEGLGEQEPDFEMYHVQSD